MAWLAFLKPSSVEVRKVAYAGRWRRRVESRERRGIERTLSFEPDWCELVRVLAPKRREEPPGWDVKAGFGFALAPGPGLATDSRLVRGKSPERRGFCFDADFLGEACSAPKLLSSPSRRSICRAKFVCSAVMREITVPDRPARAVRPERCT